MALQESLKNLHFIIFSGGKPRLTALKGSSELRATPFITWCNNVKSYLWYYYKIFKKPCSIFAASASGISFGFLSCMLEKTRDLVLENQQRETSINWVGRPERGTQRGGHYHSNASCRKNCQLQTSTDVSITYHNRGLSSRKESWITGPQQGKMYLASVL